MRTTLTLDADVADQLRALQRRRRVSFKELVNATLRAGLSASRKSAASGPRFEVHPHDCGFRPGIDLERLNQLADDLEVAARAAETRATYSPDER